MNVVLLCAVAIYYLALMRRPHHCLVAVERRLAMDMVDIQVDPSWLVNDQLKDTADPIESIYLDEMKSSLLRGESLLPALNCFGKVLDANAVLQKELGELRNLLQSKLLIQLLLLLVARLILGRLWLEGWVEFILVLFVACGVLGGLLVFERLLPIPSLSSADWASVWLPLIFTAGRSNPALCPGISEILEAERRAGLGRRQARFELLQHYFIQVCHKDSQRCQRFAESMVIFEMFFAALLFCGLLILPLLSRLSAPLS